MTPATGTKVWYFSCRPTDARTFRFIKYVMVLAARFSFVIYKSGTDRNQYILYASADSLTRGSQLLDHLDG